jgi:hypothetical protein
MTSPHANNPNMPFKKEGDEHPGAHHVNLLSRAAQEVLSMGMGSHSHGDITRGDRAQPTWKQRRAEITDSTEFRGNTDHMTFQYLYWDGTDWVKDTDNDWELDPLDQSFSDGDKLIVYWDSQKGIHIPIVGAGGGATLARGVVTDVDCPDAALKVNPSHMTFCGPVPDEDANGDVLVQDPFGIMDGHVHNNDRSEILGEKALIVYMYQLPPDDGSDSSCNDPEWELLLLTGQNDCDTT